MTNKLKLKPTTKKILAHLFDAESVYNTYIDLLERAIEQASMQIEAEMDTRVVEGFNGEALEQSEAIEKELDGFIQLTTGALQVFKGHHSPDTLRDSYFKAITEKLDMTEDEFIKAAKPLIKDDTLKILHGMTELSEKVLTEIDEQCYNVSELQLTNKSQLH